jgi:hypothetical protein
MKSLAIDSNRESAAANLTQHHAKFRRSLEQVGNSGATRNVSQHRGLSLCFYPHHVKVVVTVRGASVAVQVVQQSPEGLLFDAYASVADRALASLATTLTYDVAASQQNRFIRVVKYGKVHRT